MKKGVKRSISKILNPKGKNYDKVFRVFERINKTKEKRRKSHINVMKFKCLRRWTKRQLQDIIEKKGK